MAWFKVDDQAAFNPKVMRAGNAAFGAWVRMGAYCNAQRTDGFVTEDTATLIASRRELDAAITAGMLHAVEGGYQIHDYLKYQPSKAEIEESLAAARERMRARRSPGVRANNSGTSSEVPVRLGSDNGSVVSSGSDPLSNRVIAAWRSQTGNLVPDASAAVDMVEHIRAAVSANPEHMPEAYIAAFVAWVKSCNEGKRPQMAPRKFVEHFAIVQEWVRGERGHGDGTREYANFSKPRAAVTETRDDPEFK